MYQSKRCSNIEITSSANFLHTDVKLAFLQVFYIILVITKFIFVRNVQAFILNVVLQYCAEFIKSDCEHLCKTVY